MGTALFDFLQSATKCHWGVAWTDANTTLGVGLGSLARVLLLAVDAECDGDHLGYVRMCLLGHK